MTPPLPAGNTCSTAPFWVLEVRSWLSAPALCTLCPEGAAATAPTALQCLACSAEHAHHSQIFRAGCAVVRMLSLLPLPRGAFWC